MSEPNWAEMLERYDAQRGANVPDLGEDEDLIEHGGKTQWLADEETRRYVAKLRDRLQRGHSALFRAAIQSTDPAVLGLAIAVGETLAQLRYLEEANL